MSQDEKNKEHSLDPTDNSFALMRRARSRSGLSLQETLLQLREALKDAPSPAESAALRKKIDAAEKTQKSIDALAVQIELSMAAGGRPVKVDGSVEDIKHKALHNYSITHGVTLHEAQQKVDELLCSGSAKDFAQLVQWSQMSNQNDNSKPERTLAAQLHDTEQRKHLKKPDEQAHAGPEMGR